MTRRPIRYAVVVGLLGIGICVAVLTGLFRGDVPLEETILAAYREGEKYPALEIAYPFSGACFPPEIVAPTFRWKDEQAAADTWLITIRSEDDTACLSFLTHSTRWTPSPGQWEAIKELSLEQEAEVAVLGVKQSAADQILSAGSITISTSKDEVGAPLFYREVNLPFIEAVKDPSRIRWRFGTISSKEGPRVVLKDIPTCANCHSFSADGSILAMEVDSANDKGSYVIAPVEEEMVFDRSKIITWSDYRKEDKQPTFGLLPRISPDGKYVVCTVKDRSVFVPKPGIEFSQLFFPIRGILVYYCRETQTFHALPGADDLKFVHANPTWSPDGKTILFARQKAYHLKNLRNKHATLLTAEECREFLQEGKTFPFDLYRIPFDDGKGGKPEPLEGASNNGVSNYFPKYSPDGKWIVFCRAKSFMLLQPDSELYIVPATGGKARRLRCNTSRMNSWHSWSPNGKWLVFSSKLNGPYTQLFLTHLDQQGHSSPPVLLSNFTASDRAANIPEFVNVGPTAIKRIRQQFLDDTSFFRAATEFHRTGELETAARGYRKALELNPNNADAHCNLSDVLNQQGKHGEAIGHCGKALQINPQLALAHNNWGNALLKLRKVDPAIEHYEKAVEIDPRYAEAYHNWGSALLFLGKVDQAITRFKRTIEIDPEHAFAHCNLGNALNGQGQHAQAIEHCRKALEINPRLAHAHYILGRALSKLGEVHQAVEHYEKALEINPQDIDAHNRLARLLATCPTDGIRDGARAVELAERVCRATGHKMPELMDTLAAAYAEAGRFPEAVAAATKALGMIPADQEALARGIRQRLAHYQAGRPYRVQP